MAVNSRMGGSKSCAIMRCHHVRECMEGVRLEIGVAGVPSVCATTQSDGRAHNIRHTLATTIHDIRNVLVMHLPYRKHVIGGWTTVSPTESGQLAPQSG